MNLLELTIFNYRLRDVQGGLISLMNKGILKSDKGLYSIHYKLIPYIRKKANLDYGAATRGTYTN